MKTKKLEKILFKAGFEQTNEFEYVCGHITIEVQPGKLSIETLDNYFDIHYENMGKEEFLSEISIIINVYQDEIIDIQNTINTFEAIMQSSCK